MVEEIFDFDSYLQIIKDKNFTILSRTDNDEFTYDILDTEKTKRNKLLALKEKQRQMKIGNIWQEVLGNYDTFVDLGIGHETGLDIMSHKRKIAIELKNRTNTDNASSRKSNLDKLAKFKKEHPDYTCVYGNVNGDTEKKTLNGSIKNIMHNDVEIKQYIGMELFKLILGDNTNVVIEFMKKMIDEKSL